MARVTKKKEEKKEEAVAVKAAATTQTKAEVKVEKSLTRAEKKTATQQLIKEVLQDNSRKHNDLIDEVSKNYAVKFGGEETENINDVKGRVGSVLDIMKKEGEVLYEGGMYALKVEKTEEKPTKKVARAKTKKAEKVEKVEKMEMPAEEVSAVEEVKTAEKSVKEEKAEPAKKAVKKTAKKVTKVVEKEKEAEKQTETEETLPLPPAPLQPIAPTAPVTPEIAPEPIPEKKEPAKKTTRSKVKKAVEIIVEKETPSQSSKTENEPPMSAMNDMEVLQEAVKEKKEEQSIEVIRAVEVKNPPVVKEKKEIAQKSVMDMSFLFGGVKPKTEETAKIEKAETPMISTLTPEKEIDKTPVKAIEVKEKPKNEIKTELKTEIKKESKDVKDSKQDTKYPTRRPATRENVKDIRRAEKPQTADERLRDAYLKRMRALGGDYFEYYSVYLLERYSMKNGRRLEGLRISGGDHDGGIDGEIELTDKFGFKETIYIQSKNWDPEKGKEEYWVVGETLLQQFIGACACRQAKDRKQHCRGIFVTTSRFTPEAKRILDDMSDKIVGYDGADLYEAAKECQFGVIYENGNWKLDEKLLSGTKAFFNML